MLIRVQLLYQIQNEKRRTFASSLEYLRQKKVLKRSDYSDDTYLFKYYHDQIFRKCIPDNEIRR
ncbi:hypothetical protein Peur_033785 [Populus x canadensis]